MELFDRGVCTRSLVTGVCEWIVTEPLGVYETRGDSDCWVGAAHMTVTVPSRFEKRQALQSVWAALRLPTLIDATD